MRVLFGLIALFATFAGAWVLSGGEVQPADRVVSIQTTACGHASATSGTGVIIGDGRVLTTAHTVSGAGTVSVGAAGEQLAGTVEAYDPIADLAVLRVSGVSAPAIELGVADVGDSLALMRTDPPRKVEVTVSRRAEVRIEEVRSPARSARLSIEFDQRVALGDSGAGLFDRDGHLVAVVYGRSQTRDDRSFAVRLDHIAPLIAADPTEHRCNPEMHQIVPVQ